MQPSMRTTLIAILGVLAVTGIAAAVWFSQAPEPSAPVVPDKAQEMPPNDPRMNNDAMEQNGAMMDDGTTKADDAMMDDAAMKKEETMMKDEGAMMQKGSYEAYAQEKLALANNGDIVLFFRASWCPTCRALDADIRANLSSIPDGLVILDVDYDNSSALKQKYGVTYQHTFVQVDANGNQIAKWTGSPTLAALALQVK